MPIAEKINISGYVFNFVSDEGVVLTPEHLPYLNEPRFQEALEYGLAIFADFAEFGYATEYGERYEPSQREIPEKYQEFRQHMVKKFTAWNAQSLDKSAEHKVAFEHSMVEKRRKDARGFIYLLVCGNGLHKIGVAKKPAVRLSAFKNSMPFPAEQIRYEFLLEVDDMAATESQLHAKYAEKRITGEWFNLDASDVGYIKSLAGVS